MFKSILTILATIIVVTIFSQQASARRIRMAIPGTSESIVKVLNFPDIPALRRRDGKYIDLGYKFNRLSGGDWVGYIGSSSSYLKLNKAQISMLLAIAGVDKLPPVPSRSSASKGWRWILGLLFVVGAVVMIKRFLSRVASFFRGGKKPVASAKKFRQPVEDVPDFQDFDAAIEARLQERARKPMPSASGFGRRTAPASFGQRA